MYVTLNYLLCSLGLLVCIALGSRCETACGKEVCETTEGVRFCAEMKGQCDLYHLVPGEKTNIKMDMFHIAILNQSNRPIRIVPEYFCGVTADGRIVVMDPPLYESIEFKAKLRTKELEPKQQTEGFLFFPASSGLIRSLIYTQDPFIEMLLY